MEPIARDEVVAIKDWRRPDLQRRYGLYFSWYLLRRFRPSGEPGDGEKEP